MIPSLLRDINPADTEGIRLTIIQQWIEQAVINAGITIPVDPFLRDINPADTEGIRVQIIQKWLTLLANNISGGGGGGSSVQASVVSLTAGVTNKAITFATGFAAAPSVLCQLVPPGGGNTILCEPTSITASGFTAQWGFAVPAGYSLAWMATKTTQ